MDRKFANDLDRHITGNYGEDHPALADVPECCSHGDCGFDAAPFSDLCEGHLAQDVFARIARQNAAMAYALNSTNPEDKRNEALEIWLPEGGAK